MESALRKEIQDFIRVCERFGEFSQQHNGLTDKEREVVFLYFIQALNRRVIQTPQEDEEKAA